MRRIKAPIFGNSPVPGGRLEDIYESLPGDTRDLVMTKPCGKYDYTLHKFSSEEQIKETLLEDASRCPADMGGGSRGMGPARVEWARLSNYKRQKPAVTEGRMR